MRAPCAVQRSKSSQTNGGDIIRAGSVHTVRVMVPLERRIEHRRMRMHLPGPGKSGFLTSRSTCTRPDVKPDARR